jgi:dihydroorotate dehydrogenase (NAD+) catalytic subunit
VEFLLVGAAAVQVGTANFIDPSTGVKVADGLRSFAEEQGLTDVGQLVRAMQSDVKFSILQSWL